MKTRIESRVSGRPGKKGLVWSQSGRLVLPEEYQLGMQSSIHTPDFVGLVNRVTARVVGEKNCDWVGALSDIGYESEN